MVVTVLLVGALPAPLALPVVAALLALVATSPAGAPELGLTGGELAGCTVVVEVALIGFTASPLLSGLIGISCLFIDAFQKNFNTLNFN